MSQATMVGQCAPDDAACSRRHPQAPIAIGTRFFPEVAAEIQGSSTPNLVIESAAPEVLSVEDGALRAHKAGASAVLITTDDGSVVDFMTMWVAPVTTISVARRDGDRIGDAVGLAVGEDLTVVATLWNGAQRLAGDGDAQWTVSREGPISVLRDGASERRRIRARAPGKATIAITHGDVHTAIDVEVVP